MEVCTHFCMMNFMTRMHARYVVVHKSHLRHRYQLKGQRAHLK